MKHHINRLLRKTRTPEWNLATLGTCAGILGGVVLLLSLIFFLLYEFSGVSGWIAPEVVPDLRSLLRCFAFGVVPPLGAAFVAISLGIRDYRLKKKLQLTPDNSAV